MGQGTVFHIQIITKANVTEQNIQKVKIPFLRMVHCFQTTLQMQPNVFTMEKAVCNGYEAVLYTSVKPLTFGHQSQLTFGYI
jgi:hypothetical protein